MESRVSAVFRGVRVGCGIGILFLSSACILPAALINFETAPIHPLALSEGGILAVCNLPDGRVELFDVASGVPVPVGNVAAGVDPVSLRFHTPNELWIANHISRTISIVDVAGRRVVDTISTLDGPADIVFAGTPLRAFVSCAKENTVQVFDPLTRQCITNLVIDGERPKAMTVSPDGRKVYVAIFESGNASTILVGTQPDTRRILTHPNGPYGGVFPPPNNGPDLQPPMNPNLFGTEQFLPDSLIVKKDAFSRWMDDNGGDWTEFISGTNAGLSGRIAGWDLADRDLAAIDTATLDITYVTGLMNICMDVAVNPASGRITVIGTDGTNERRFEPNLRGTFMRVNLAMVEPTMLGKTVLDLNPHLDYSTASVPQSVRDLSVGDPRGIIWNGAGTRGYVTGMGSRNLIVIDADGQRTGPPLELDEGPSGLALDEMRGRLYVLNRFSASVSVLHTDTLTVVTNVPIFDPTPYAIRAGRKHLYDTRRNSGLGHIACASCHVDSRFDRLAWDLGNPAGEPSFFPGQGVFFHPMKGPLVTQTFQDIIVRNEAISFLPLHWRGDRPDIESFNITFTDLLGRDTPLTAVEMQEFKDFLSTIYFAPNRFRNFDNSLPTNLPLPGLFGINTNGVPDRTPLPPGNAAAGAERFFTEDFNGLPQFALLSGRCVVCHNRQSGRGTEGDITLFSREDMRPFKAAQLRSIAEKIGMDRRSTNSRAGFGFRFDGRTDTLTSLFAEIFQVTNNQVIADMTAFLLAFPSGFPPRDEVPFGFQDDSQDMHAAVAKQFTVRAPAGHPLLPAILEMARVSDEIPVTGDVVVRGMKDGLNRSWQYADPAFQSDRHGEVATTAELLNLATPEAPLTFTVVPPGTGRRIGLDHDEDGVFDQSELDYGFDPNNSLSHPNNQPPVLQVPFLEGRVHPGARFTTTFSATDPDVPTQTLSFELEADAPPHASVGPDTGVFTWTPPAPASDSPHSFRVRVTDSGNPPLSDVKVFTVQVHSLRVIAFHFEGPAGGNIITSTALPGRNYRLQYKERLEAAEWLDAGQVTTSNGSSVQLTDATTGNSQQRFYRVTLVE